MAREELDICQNRLPELEEEIKILLVPADPQDGKNAILEIRGGTGGDETAIFLQAICSACTQKLRKQRMENGSFEL